MTVEYVELKKIALYFQIDSYIDFSEYDEKFFHNKVNIYSLENLLYELTLKIRRYWSEKKCSLSLNYLKSPHLNNENLLKLNKSTYFEYERGIPLSKIEKKWQYIIEGVANKTVLFSSGMSAIDSVLRTLINTKKKKKVKILCFCAYFETISLLKLYDHSHLDIIFIEKENEVKEILKKDTVDILFIEPTKYNWNLDNINISNLLNMINKYNRKNLTYVVTDTTLHGENSIIESWIKNSLKDNNFLFFIDIKSGLKLNQLGLELSNLGIVNIYSNSKRYNVLLSLADSLKSVRVITGSNLSFFELCLLDSNFLGNSDYIKNYQEKIFENNSFFANNLNEGGFIKKIVFPRDSNINLLTPFLFIHLYNNDDYENIMNYVKESFEKKGMFPPIGNSFGFRETRLELIETKDEIPIKVIKIACGTYKGASLLLLLEIFNELSLNTNKTFDVNNKKGDI
ncbi:PLP-dependent transferase [Staphylococcus chromogenes]|nr:PLP-dependent transferase [Staphylococcus chromogenes]